MRIILFLQVIARTSDTLLHCHSGMPTTVSCVAKYPKTLVYYFQPDRAKLLRFLDQIARSEISSEASWNWMCNCWINRKRKRVGFWKVMHVCRGDNFCAQVRLGRAKALKVDSLMVCSSRARALGGIRPTWIYYRAKHHFRDIILGLHRVGSDWELTQVWSTVWSQNDI